MTVLRALKFSDEVKLKDKQEEALQHIAAGRDLLAVLPTGYGKSYVFQLPALALSGVTIVVSPLVALMTDQALELNKTIGGAVRALVAPMRESNSRTGKVEVYEQLTQPDCQHGIKLVYLSPERLCQRHFQDQIREGVRLGLIRRIVIDEAHTLVQWGDDFRPGFRRAELFLQELRAEQPELQLIALTATATWSVLDSLRSRLFQADPGSPAPDSLGFVQANPIRPELALYRRQLAGGDPAIAGLLEAVVGVLREHAIVYCLTVKEVEHHCHHLSTVLDDPSRLRKFHGRMSESEKLAVANDFRRMGRHGEDGFVPMIVIATSAFGLGVDRDDVRLVFVLSPPTDLAALYQQLGRAGRDGKPSTGLALSHGRGYRTIAFMTRRRPEDASLPARAAASLVGGAELLNLRGIAQSLAKEDARQGMSPDEATVERYQTMVVRVLAHLDASGLIEDLGDLPETVAILPGSIEPDVPGHAQIVAEILDATRDDPRHVDLEALHSALASRPQLLSLFPDELADCGATWSLLMDLHALGHLDISQQPNRAYLTAIRVTGDAARLPAILQDFDRRQQRVDAEVHRLQEFFESQCCVNESFREYFGAPELPRGTCVAPKCRCSWCWNQPGHHEEHPELLTAFETHTPTPASASSEFRQAQAKLLEQRILNLLLSRRWKGLAESLIGPTLRGEDFYTNKTKGRTPLWGVLRNSLIFGSFPGLRREVLHQALVQLETRGQVVRDGAFWKHTRFAGSNRASATAASASAGRD
jgi:RecQ family ATP-dependent DNA helicase